MESKRLEAYATNVVHSVAAIVQRKDRKVPVIWEGNMPYHNMWVVPMGYVHTNENVIDAVQREVREETRLDIEIEGSLGVYDDFTNTDDRSLHHVMVCCKTMALTDPPTVSREAKEYVWVGRRQVKGLRALVVVRNMLSDYFRSQRLSLF